MRDVSRASELRHRGAPLGMSQMSAVRRKMRILYVVDSLMAGGIESQLVELVVGLDRTHFAPTVLSLYGPTVRDLHFAPRLQAAHVPLVLPNLGWSARDKLCGIAAIVRVAHRLRPDLIQAEGYHANLLMRLAWPLLPWHAHLIGSLRGTYTAKQMRYERFSHWMCTRIVTNAPQLKADLVRRGHVAERRVVYIPNGIALDRYAHPHDPGLRERLAPGARLMLASLGRISFEKNMHWCVQALGVLKRQGRLPERLRLFIVGAVQDACAQAALEAAIRQDGLDTVVTQQPATLHPQDYYHACDAVILFSPSEGLPNVAIEALAAGCPVVISAAANAADVIEAGRSGWVVQTGDVAALAEALDAVAKLPAATRAQMHLACLERAEHYSVANLVQCYTAFYESLHYAVPRPEHTAADRVAGR
jgi:glycosyltransferase involved in cell wall biosynthesis